LRYESAQPNKALKQTGAASPQGMSPGSRAAAPAA